MPEKTQVSSDNAGWVGRGTPSVKHLNARMWKKGWDALRRGQLMRIVRKGVGMVVNAYHFTLRKGQKTVTCPCCGWEGPAFAAESPGRRITFNSSCPRCDSRSRHRGLALLLPEILPEQHGDWLVFAPEKVMLDLLSRLGISYHTTDLNSVDVDFPGEDIQALSFEAESFGGILCNHVLEHVPEDRLAMRECWRVLVPGGVAIFTLAGYFDRRETRVLPKPDWMGHHRYYGTEVCDAFAEARFKVQMIDMGAEVEAKWGERQSLRYGVRPGDMAFLCTKPMEAGQA